MAKRAGVESQYCVVPRKSIKLLGESLGIGYLSSEVASTLAEDASYRIRQSIQSASQFVKHGKRDHMTGDDVNRALFWSHVEPIYGYGSKNSNIFSSISTKDGDLFFHEDKEINLRELAFSKGFSSLSDLGSCEINVEVSVLGKPSASKSDSQGDTQPSSAKPEFDSLNPVLKSYFNQVTRNIITADVKTVKVILDDLKTNTKIQILLPYLVHFITTAIQTLIEEIPKLLRVFDLIKALIDNKHLYLEPYVVQLVRAVMYCLIEKPVSKISTSWLDDWSLRNRSAQMLCHIDRKCSNAGNFLHLQLLRTFKDIYHASDRPLLCQYGAVTGLTMLDVDAIEQTIFPHLNDFSDILVRMQDNDPTPEKLIEILHILDILKMSTISVFRNKLKTIAMMREKQEQLQKSRPGHRASTNATDSTYKSNMADSKQWNKHVPEWYKQMYDVAGDALVLFLGNVEDYENFTPCKPVSVTQFRTSMLNQSKLQYIRKMIQNALDTREKKPSDSPGFSLQAEKTRRLKELSMSQHNGFSNGENSQLRFQNLVENSVRAKRNLNFRSRIGKLSCLSAKRTSFSFRKTIAVLSLPL